MRCRAAPSNAPDAGLFLYRQGADPRLRHRRAVRPQRPPAAFLVAFRRRQGDHRRASSPRFNCVGHRLRPVGHARWAASSARSSRPSTICSGLKFRIGGLGGHVLAKLGVVPQQIAAGDVYPALERGTIDAAEFVGPYDDEKLGLSKVAKYYYAPGWWEGGAMLHLLVNRQKWDELPKSYQAIPCQACEAANNWMLAKYDAVNAQALRRMVGAGAELRLFPQPIMEASLKAANELYAELSEKSPDFKRAYDSMVAYPCRRAALVAAQRVPLRHLHGAHAGTELALHLSPLAGRGRLGRKAERVRAVDGGARRRQPLTLALRARFAASAAKPSPRLRGEVRSPRLALARIEVLLQPGPAVDVVLLQRRAFGRVACDPLREAGLEHEGQRACRASRASARRSRRARRPSRPGRAAASGCAARCRPGTKPSGFAS